ncbi:MAG: gluconate 2-dehydrogenase subunit 3 family protein [Myxococcota bacterium]|nr:gluconate 2-dehydrogenase subunit 3 family protein [Myxococcota bacterium]
MTDPTDQELSAPPKITRRQALAVGGLVAAAGAAGLGIRVASWWDQPAEEGFLCLSSREAELVDSLAEALFPPGGTPALSGADAGISRYFDWVVDSIPPPTQHLLRSFLHALDDTARITRLSSYASLPLDERTELLGDWAQSPHYLFRSSVSSLVLFLSMGYCGHPEVRDACGWVFPCGYGR